MLALIEETSPAGTVRGMFLPSLNISATTDALRRRIGDPEPLMAIKLLIVDDHAEFRTFARAMLTDDGFEITGEAPDGESVLAALQGERPDAVLLDIQLPGIDGFEVARLLAALRDPPRVVLTSSREASDYGQRLSQSPARGFLAKRDLSGAALAEILALG